MTTTLEYDTIQVHPVHLSIRRFERRVFFAALVIADVAALAFAAAVAYYLRFMPQFALFESVSPDSGYYMHLAALLIPLWIFVFYQFQLYNLHTLLGGTAEYARVVNACTFAIMVLIGVSFFGHVILARGWIILFWLLSIACAGLARLAMRQIAYAARRRGYLRTTTLVVGADDEGQAIANQLRSARTCGADVIGFLDDTRPAGQPVDGLPVIGRVNLLERVIEREKVEAVLLSITALSRPQLLETYLMLGARTDVELRLSPGLFEILTTGAQVKEWGYVPLVSINKLRLSNLESGIKAAVDFLVSTLGLIALAPLLLLIAIAIKRDSPGPVLYRRRVLGREGREFHAFKFRTMYVNGDAILEDQPALKKELEETQKLKDDPRVTRIGRFLRKGSLDELPQLFNVLLGQMSLVGPRMISPVEAEKYGRMRMNLLTVKPGITGMWQISGRSDISYSERIRLDMHYIRNYSLWLDLLILLRTVPAVLSGRGAY